MKKTIALLLALLMFAGCNPAPQEETEIPQSEAETEVKVETEISTETEETPAPVPQEEGKEAVLLTVEETPTAEYIPGYDTIFYRYEPETETFNIDEKFDKASYETYGALAEMAAERLSLPKPEYHGMVVDYSTLVVNWSQHFMDQLDELGMRETFLQSYSTTLGRMTRSRQFRYMVSGKIIDFSLKELKLNGWDEAAYAELRASIPYEEPYNWSEYEYQFADEFPVDEQGWEIARMAEYIWVPTYSIEGEVLLLPEDILFRALLNTEAVSVLDLPDENYQPQAQPIAIAVDDTGFYFKEHVEATTRWLFGPDTVVEHQPINKFGWFEEAGAYRPPHMSLGRPAAVAVLSYEDKGDRVEAIVVGVGYEDYGNNFVDAEYNVIPKENWKDVIENQSPRYKLTLRKGGTSGLYYESLVGIN